MSNKNSDKVFVATHAANAAKGETMSKPTFYRLGIAPFVPILSGLIFDDRKEATRRAKDENRCGEYRGRGVRVYRCNADGQIIAS